MAGMTSSGQAESDSPGTASKDPPDVRLVGGEAATLEEKVRRLEAQNRELANAALTDPLTGLLNHRASHEQLDVELQRAGREQYPVAVLALDIDFFKGLNDSWGHVWGDKILRRVAERFEADLRPGDICGRLGGDEFVIALPKSNAQEGESIFERLRVTVALLEFDPVHIPVTVSAGMARFPFDATTVTELLAVADQALYRAKLSGRDRCVVYSPDLASEETKRVHERNLRTSVEALARAVDTRNGYTYLHSQAVAHYATGLAERLGLTGQRLEMLRVAAILHDVGKDRRPRRRPVEDDAVDAGRGCDRTRSLRARPQDPHRSRRSGDPGMGPIPARALGRSGVSRGTGGGGDPVREPHPRGRGRGRRHDLPPDLSRAAHSDRGARGARERRRQPVRPNHREDDDRAGARRHAGALE